MLQCKLFLDDMDTKFSNIQLNITEDQKELIIKKVRVKFPDVRFHQ